MVAATLALEMSQETARGRPTPQSWVLQVRVVHQAPADSFPRQVVLSKFVFFKLLVQATEVLHKGHANFICHPQPAWSVYFIYRVSHFSLWGYNNSTRRGHFSG